MNTLSHSEEVSLLAFALNDISVVKAVNPHVSPGAARLLRVIEQYPAACRASLVTFVSQVLWPGEAPHDHAALYLAYEVAARVEALAQRAAA